MKKIVILVRPYALYILAVWVITILAVSSIPHLPVVKLHTAKSDIRLDYAMHMAEYGFLAFLAYLSFAGKDFRISNLKYALVTSGLLVFAFADEFHQRFIPGRTFNIIDLLSNSAGIMLALVLSVIIFRKIVSGKNITG